MQQLRLKPADSFDLIRLLARSQNDARKAVCELVQNSLDAQATRIEVTWQSEKGGTRALRIHDNGGGIFSDLSREDALRRIATTIGHSHKRALTPAQRRELMALGKYGIGLLGFWAIGQVMEIKSRVGGGDTWCLRLREEMPNAELERMRARRLIDEPTYTEVTIRGVHDAASRQVRPGRLQAYLAGELRGQLLERGVEIRIHDRIARGTAVKEFVVRPQRFRGVPLAELRSLEVEGREEARLELYLVPADEERAGVVVLSCGGTTVLDDVAEIDGTGEPRQPWGSGRFEGVVDFPELDVAPGTRRGFRRDDAAEALLAAMPALEARLALLLQEDDRRRQEERDRNLARKIQRVFRRIPRWLPDYDLFDVKGQGKGGGAAAETGAALGEAPTEALAPAGGDGIEETGEDGAAALLFPPGPLAAVEIRPAKSQIPVGAVRQLRAWALDGDGRRLADQVDLAWRLDGPGALQFDGGRATYSAPAHPGSATVVVRASQGEVTCEARAAIEVLEEIGAPNIGIPEPVPMHAQAEPWRSRLRERAWEYNTGHKDYAAASATEARRLRYLVQLFAKEVVLRNFGGDGALLERMVEVLTYLDEVDPEKTKAVRGAKDETVRAREAAAE